MNRLSLSILTLFITLIAAGQLIPPEDHYLYDAQVINPAYAGSQDALSVTLLYRNQWTGFRDAPKDQLLSVHAPLHNDRIGLGLAAEHQSIGIFSKNIILGQYAFRIELGRGVLAMGLGFGVASFRNAWNDLEINDENDEKLINNLSSVILPAFSIGTYYYGRKYYIGISLPAYLGYHVDQYAGGKKINSDFASYNYFLTGGYRFELSRNIRFLPSFVLRYQPETNLQADLRAQLGISDRIWLGIGYRNEEMLTGLFRCRISDQLRVSYSYIYYTGGYGKYLNGTQEVMLNYVFRYERYVNSPRNF